jgi:hypothetical protein
MEGIRELIDKLVLDRLTNEEKENYNKLSEEDKIIYINKYRKQYEDELRRKSLIRVLKNKIKKKYIAYYTKQLENDGIDEFIKGFSNN